MVDPAEPALTVYPQKKKRQSDLPRVFTNSKFLPILLVTAGAGLSAGRCTYGVCQH